MEDLTKFLLVCVLLAIEPLSQGFKLVSRPTNVVFRLEIVVWCHEGESETERTCVVRSPG